MLALALAGEVGFRLMGCLRGKAVLPDRQCCRCPAISPALKARSPTKEGWRGWQAFSLAHPAGRFTVVVCALFGRDLTVWGSLCRMGGHLCRRQNGEKGGAKGTYRAVAGRRAMPHAAAQCWSFEVDWADVGLSKRTIT